MLETERPKASVVFEGREMRPSVIVLGKTVLYFTLLILMVEEAGYSSLLIHTRLPIKNQKDNPRPRSNEQIPRPNPQHPSHLYDYGYIDIPRRE